MNAKILIIGTVVLIILGGAVFLLFGKSDSGSSSVASNTFKQENQRKLPNLMFQDYDGNSVVLTDFVGKPMVVNSWAKWCPFCVDELPDFAELQSEFGASVIFIGINRAEPLSVAKAFIDSLGITSNMIFLVDPKDDFYKAIGGFTMPETIFVDAEGNIKFQKKGVMSIDEIRKRTQELL